MWYIDTALKKTEGNSVTCYNMDETWGHNSEWNKPITKRQWCYIYKLCNQTLRK